MARVLAFALSLCAWDGHGSGDSPSLGAQPPRRRRALAAAAAAYRDDAAAAAAAAASGGVAAESAAALREASEELLQARLSADAPRAERVVARLQTRGVRCVAGPAARQPGGSSAARHLTPHAQAHPADLDAPDRRAWRQRRAARRRGRAGPDGGLWCVASQPHVRAIHLNVHPAQAARRTRWRTWQW